jgi:23S rRNA pseudouridine1911/1915/1917 synthase
VVEIRQRKSVHTNDMIPSMHDVRHIRAPTAGRLIDIIVPLIIDAEYRAHELIRFGAVYVDKVRETSPDAMVQSDAYLRIHTKPRRFPMVSKVDWPKRIIHASDEVVIIDKPGGVPVHGSTDNILETCMAEVERIVGSALHPLHRLDVPTHGLLAFGKTPSFSAHFCSMMRQGHVRKEYLALTYRAPTLGLMVHFMKPSERSPKVVERDAPESNWQECKLVVKAVNMIPFEELSKAAQEVIAAQQTPSNSMKEKECAEIITTTSACTYEVRIELLTGRTHQIRAQLSKEGCYIVGDVMYNGQDEASGADGPGAEETNQLKTLAREMEEEGTLALQAVRLQFPRMGAVAHGERKATGHGPHKYVKQSKRQRREARVRDAEERSRPAPLPDGAAGDDTGPPAAADAGERAETARSGPAYAEEDTLRFELHRPWWRAPADTPARAGSTPAQADAGPTGAGQ